MLQGDDLDAIILSHAEARWLKVARIAARTLAELGLEPTDLNVEPVLARLRDLVARGALERQGDLSRPRFSEVRLPGATRRQDDE